MDFANTQTKDNLLAAFAGESQARNKYTFYAQIARKKGFEAVARIFEETAENERQHAKIWFELLKGKMPDLAAALADAAAGERYEWERMYPEFEKTAQEEGFADIARLFRLVGSVESHHEQRFSLLQNQAENSTLLHTDSPTEWVCAKCGYVHHGQNPPEVCPLCKHPQGFFLNQDIPPHLK